MPLSGQFHKNERMCFISCCLFLAVCYRFEDVFSYIASAKRAKFSAIFSSTVRTQQPRPSLHDVSNQVFFLSSED